ncbi:hypothetical protein ACFYWN_32055 [Streptomyces sp. NPDC002917]|uniref:hypothetical protein n=1 Tax=Streptomyces sp. NPDC002917 TaxID=3364671 RepID=UPI003690264A
MSRRSFEATAEAAATALGPSRTKDLALPCPEAAAYLRGYVAAQLRARDAVQVRTVWSGPSTPAVPVRATAQVLVEVINDARDELLARTMRPAPIRR